MAIQSVAEKERAKRIIVEVIRQAGGSFTRKTNFYKAFYHAHLQYAENNPDYLSAWPIVRMPRGPGIDNFDVLLGELLLTGLLHIGTEKIGPKIEATRFELTEIAENSFPLLSEPEIAAIKYGLSKVDGKTASQCSHESHEYSRSWRLAEDGDELNIYIDSLTEEAFNDLQERADKISVHFALTVP